LAGEDIGQERPFLQDMASFKCDNYQQYSPGMRFVESLALWLDQFRTREERASRMSSLSVNSSTCRSGRSPTSWPRSPISLGRSSSGGSASIGLLGFSGGKNSSQSGVPIDSATEPDSFIARHTIAACNGSLLLSAPA